MKKVLLCFGLMILFSTVVTAAITEIKVKTAPHHEVQISIIDGSSTLIESYKNQSDEYGDIVYYFDSTRTKFNVIVYIKKDGERVMSPKMVNNHPGEEPLYLELMPPGMEPIETPKPEPEINETEEELDPKDILMDEPEIEETDESSWLTGLAVSKIKDKVFSRGVLYTFFGVFGLVVIVLVFTKFKGHLKGAEKEIKIKKLSEIQNEKKEETEKIESLAEAEKKLKEAKREVARLQNADKIAELKKRIKENEEALIKLRNGD